MDLTLTTSPSSTSGSQSSAVTPDDVPADVPPGGKVDDPTENDVLCGRGGSINSHAGNENFRLLVENRKRVYLTARFKREKRLIACSIVSEIRQMNPPGRFLAKKGGKDGFWYDIGDEKARDKTSQALRENAPTIRAEIETERQEKEEDEVGTPNGTHPYPPQPSHAYAYQQYWDYYYSYYGYYAHPPHGAPPPPHGVPGPPLHGVPGPPPHGAPPPHHGAPGPPPHGAPPPHHGAPGPPPHGAPGPPPHGASHRDYHGAPPAHPPPQQGYSHHPPPQEGYWGMPPPPPREAVRSLGQEEFKDEGDCIDNEGGQDRKTTHPSPQEDEDHRIAKALQEQLHLEAVQARRKRQVNPNHARSARGCAQYFGTNPLPIYDGKRPRTTPMSPVASASTPIQQGSNDSHLTQEERDHRLAVALQEQEDNVIRYRRAALEGSSRRTSRSNAHYQVKRPTRDAIMPSHGTNSSFPASFFSFGSQSASESEKKPIVFKTNQGANSSQRRQVQSGHGSQIVPRPLTTTFGGGIGYTAVDYQSQDNMVVSDPKDQQMQPQGTDESNSSLLSQVASHILGGFGAWSTSANETSGGGSPSDAVRARKAPSQQSPLRNHNRCTEPNRTIKAEGHEVQLSNFKDESSMPPPPRVQIDWPSRVSCNSWIPETMGSGTAPFFGGQTNERRGSHHSFSNYGISPANSIEMDVLGSGTDHFSCAGSVGGGSLCQVFDPADMEGQLTPMNHRALNQVPSWEHSIRSKSPVSIDSIEEDDDVMIRVRDNDKLGSFEVSDGHNSYGHNSHGHHTINHNSHSHESVSFGAMTPSRDEESSARSTQSMSTDMEWE